MLGSWPLQGSRRGHHIYHVLHHCLRWCQGCVLRSGGNPCWPLHESLERRRLLLLPAQLYAYAWEHLICGAAPVLLETNPQLSILYVSLSNGTYASFLPPPRPQLMSDAPYQVVDSHGWSSCCHGAVTILTAVLCSTNVTRLRTWSRITMGRALRLLWLSAIYNGAASTTAHTLETAAIINATCIQRYIRAVPVPECQAVFGHSRC